MGIRDFPTGGGANGGGGVSGLEPGPRSPIFTFGTTKLLVYFDVKQLFLHPANNLELSINFSIDKAISADYKIIQ